MKKIMRIMAIALLACLNTNHVVAQTNRELRHQYVMKNLKLDKKTAALFAPLLKQYLDELKVAKSAYDDLKDKYKDMEKAGVITNGQAEQLLNAKFECDAKELVVKKKFYAEWRKVLPLKKVYYAFDLTNDKKSKIRGEE